MSNPVLVLPSHIHEVSRLEPREPWAVIHRWELAYPSESSRAAQPSRFSPHDAAVP
jgi:hypothetical protein